MDPLFDKNFITTKEASKISGYASDYLARLARSGKIIGRRVGHSWFIDRDSLSRFSGDQGDRKVDHARSLARAREEEYRAHRSLLRRIGQRMSYTSGVSLRNIGRSSLSARAFSLALASLILIASAGIAESATTARLLAGAGDLMQEISLGFSVLSADAAAHFATQVTSAGDAMRDYPPRIAARTETASETFASSALAYFDFSDAQRALDENNSTHKAPIVAVTAFQNSDIGCLNLCITEADAATFIRDAYAFATDPSLVAQKLSDTYVALGATAYDAIIGSFSAYESFIRGAGALALTLGIDSRDTLASAPRFVNDINLALGTAIIDASHAAIDADVALAYFTADAAPRSARITAEMLGGAGARLADATSRAPALATALFLRATAFPAEEAPQIARAIFDVEYRGATHFLTFADRMSQGSLALFGSIGQGVENLTYAGTSGVAVLAHNSAFVFHNSAPLLQDASLGALGKSAVGFDKLTTGGFDKLTTGGFDKLTTGGFDKLTTGGLAAVLGAAEPTLTFAERTALATYRTLSSIFDSAANSLAFLWSPAPIIVVSNTYPSIPKTVVTTTPDSNVGPTRSHTSTTPSTPSAVTYRLAPSAYQPSVQGVSTAFLNQSLALLRSDILAQVAGLVTPIAVQTNRVTHYTETRTFTGGDIGSAISMPSFSATDPSVSSSIAGNLAIAGNLNAGTITTAGTITFAGLGRNMLVTTDSSGTLVASSSPQVAALFATSTTATSTFAGGLAVGTSKFVVDSTTGNVGIATANSAYQLQVGNGAFLDGRVNLLGSQPFLRIEDTDSPSPFATNWTLQAYNGRLRLIGGTVGELLSIASSTGNIGIGTTTPWGLLSVNPNGITGPAFVVGNSTATNFIVTNAGNVGIGTTSPGLKLEIRSAEGWNHLGLFDASSGGNARAFLGARDDTTNVYSQWAINRSSATGIFDDPNRASSNITLAAGNANGYIAFATADANNTLPSERVRITKEGNLGIGTTSPYAKLSVAGTVVGESFTATSTSGNTTLAGASITGTGALTVTAGGALTLDSSGNINIASGDDILALGANSNIGSAGIKFNTLYVDTVSATTLVGVISGGSTNAADWVINSDNASADTEDMNLVFERGTIVPNALLTWNSAQNAKRFELNHPLYISNASASTTLVTLDLKSVGGQTADIFRIASSSGTDLFNLTATGRLGVGSTTPWGLLSVNPSGITGPAFVVGSSTATNFIVTNGGNVGIGTTSPSARLTVVETSSAVDAIYSETPRSGGNRFVRVTNTPLSVVNALQVEFRLSAGTPVANSGAGISFNAPDSNNNTDQAAFLSGILTDITAGSVSGAMAFSTRYSGSAFLERMRIDALGNVGIGTTTPNQKLVVVGNTLLNSSSGAFITLDGSSRTDNAPIISWAGPSSNSFTLSAGTNNNRRFDINYVDAGSSKFGVTGQIFEGLLFYGGNGLSESMRITPTGNVGIGTTTPSNKLVSYIGASGAGFNSAVGIGLESSASAYIGLLVPNSQENGILFGSPQSNVDAGIIYNNSGNTRGLQFRANGNQTAVTIDSSLRVGIGTTSPNYKLTIDNGTSGNPGIGLTSNSTAPQGGMYLQSSGQVVKWFAGSNYLVNSAANSSFEISEPAGARLVINSGGNVGIGTTTPAHLLDVYGSSGNPRIRVNGAAGAAPGILLTQNGQTNWTIYNPPSTNDLRIFDTQDRVTFQAGGNVGIGTTSPESKLDVLKASSAGTISSTSGFSLRSGATDAALFMGADSSLDLAYLQTANVGIGFGFNLALQPSAGNVGIGTTSPGAKLDVYGDIRTNINGANIDSGLGYNLGVFSSPAAQTLRLGGANLNTVQIYNGSSVGITLNSSGNVGIGTTSPEAKLDVNGGIQLSTNNSLKINVTDPNGVPAYLYADAYAVNITTNTRGSWGAGYGALANSSASSWDTKFGGSSLAGGDYWDISRAAPTGGVPSFASLVRITSTGNVGIGSTSPAYKLGVVGSIGTTDILYNTRGSMVWSQYGSGTGYYFNANGSDKVVFDGSTGNVGIGSTTNPLAKLTVKGEGTSTGVNFQTTNSSNAPLFTILDSGNVGIGTTTPSSPLTVASDSNGNVLTLSSNSRPYISLFTPDQNNTWTMGYPQDGSNSFAIRDIDQALTPFYIADRADTNAFYITTGAGGGGTSKIGIGTTTPSAQINVVSKSTTNVSGLFTGSNNSQTADIFQLAKNPGATPGLVYTASGNLGIGTTSPYVISGTSLDVRGGANSSIISGRTANVADGSDFGAFAFVAPNASGNQRIWGKIRTIVNTAAEGSENSSLVFSTQSAGAQFEAMRVVGGNVGIGTTTPQYKLHVSGNTFIDGGALYVGVVATGTSVSSGFQVSNFANTFSESFIHSQSKIMGLYANPQGSAQIGNTGISYPGDSAGMIGNSNTSLALGAGGLERLRITTSGNVGIGTTSPGAKLEVAGGNIRLGNGYFLQGYGGDGVTARDLIGEMSGTDNIKIGGGHSDTIFYTANGERMRITSNGNVGIGTTSPDTLLQVYGSSQPSLHIGDGVNNAYLGLATAAGNFANGSLASSIVIRGSNGIQFSSNAGSGVAQTITSAGNVGIGTTNPVAYGGTTKLAVAGIIQSVGIPNSNSIQSYNTNDGTGVAIQANAGVGVIGSNNSPLLFWANGTNSMKISASNGLAFGTTYYNTDPGANNFIVEGKVGIGTTSPWGQLSVQGGTGSTNLNAVFNRSTGGNNQGVGTILTLQDNTVSAFIKFLANGATQNSNDLELWGQGGKGLSILAAGGIQLTDGVENTSADSVVTIPTQIISPSGTGYHAGFKIGNLTVAATSPLTFASSSALYIAAAPVAGTNVTLSNSYALYSQAGTNYFGGNVGIGTQTVGANLDILNNTNIIGLRIKATSTQSTDLIDIRSSGNTQLFRVASDGTTVSAATLTASTLSSSGGNIGLTNSWNIQTGNGPFQLRENSSESQIRLSVSAGGNVGIGTTSPVAKLDVAGSVLINGAQPASNRKLSFNDTALTAMAYQISGVEKWVTYTDSTSGNFGIQQALIGDRLTINTSGNVGIGTTSPAGLLTIEGSGQGMIINGSEIASRYLGGGSLSDYRFLLSNNPGHVATLGNAAALELKNYDVAAGWNIVAAANGTGGLAFLTGGSTQTNTTEQMRITSAGNVGIGTTTPGDTLSVSTANVNIASLNSTNVNGGYLRLTRSGNDIGWLGAATALIGGGGASNSDLALRAGPNANILFGVNGSETVRITSTGNVGIGTTDPSLSGSVASKLTVIQSAGNTAFAVATTTTGKGFALNVGTSGGLTIYDGGTSGATWNTGLTQTNGNVGIGTSAPGELLDVRGNIVIPTGNAYRFNDSNVQLFRGSAPVNSLNIQASGGILFSTSGSDRVIFDSSGNVGIGTTSPITKLHVVAGAGELRFQNVSQNNLYVSGTNASMILNSTNGTLPNYELQVNGVRKTLFGTDGTDSSMQSSGMLTFKAGGLGGTQHLNIATSGNVGIGTTTPQGPLHIVGSAPAIIDGPSIDGTSALDIRRQDVPGRYIKFIPSGYDGTSVFNRISFGGGARAEFNGAANYTFDGNVGIGTTSPTHKFVVAGLSTGVGSTAQFVVGDGGDNSVGKQLQIGYNTTADYGFIQPVHWGSNYKDLILNASGGNVGIGTTSPQGKLHVYDSAGGYIMADSAAAGTSQFRLLKDNVLKWAAYIPANSSDLRFFDTGDRVTFQAGGNVGIGTTTPGEKLVVSGVGHTRIDVVSSGDNALAGIKLVGRTANADKPWYIDSRGATDAPNNRLAIFDNAAVERFTILNGGNVGIGSTTPGRKLVVASASAMKLSTAQGALFSDTANDGGVIIGSDFLIGSIQGTNAAGTSAKNLMLQAEGGNVGIGTTNPLGKLQVGLGTSVASYKTYTASASDQGLVLDAYQDSNSSFRRISNIVALGNQDGGSGGGELVFQTNPKSSFTSAVRMVIKEDGFVGIGTTTPGSKLEVAHDGASTYGTAIRVNQTAIGNSDGPKLEFYKTMTASKRWSLGILNGVDVDDFSINEDGGITGFGTPRFTILNGGNVGIGTTTPQTNLQVSGATTAYNSDNGTIVISNSTTATKRLNLGYDTALGTNGSGYIQAVMSGTGNVPLLLNANGGNVGIGTTTPATLLEVGGSAANVTFDGYKNCTGFTSNGNGLLACTASDARLKQDIAPLSGTTTLAALNLLHPVSFAWRPETSRGNTQQYGLLAQEVQSIFPDLVTVTNPTALTPDGTLSINYEGLISPMILALQELDRRTNWKGTDFSRVATSLGFASSTLPSSLLTAGGTIDMFTLATYTLAATQHLADRLDAHDTRIKSLEDRVAMLESGAVSASSSFSTTTLMSALNSLGAYIGKGFAQFGSLVADRFVASANSAGTASAGTIVLLAGNTVAQVNNAYVTPATKVFVTFNSPVTGSWYVSDKQAGSFRITLSEAQAADVSFDYFLVQTEGQMATSTAALGEQAPSSTSSSGSTTLTTSAPLPVTVIYTAPPSTPLETSSEPVATTTPPAPAPVVTDTTPVPSDTPAPPAPIETPPADSAPTPPADAAPSP